MSHALKYKNIKSLLTFLLLILFLNCAAQEVVINEVFTSPPPSINSTGINTNSLYNLAELPYDNLEWIELYNPHPCDTVDISCYMIGSNAQSVSAGDNWGAFTFPQGTLIPPLEFIIVGGNHAQVPYLDFNISDYIPSLGVSSLDGDSIRWFLRDSWGWIAVYDPSGNAVDAVYWSQVNGPSDLYIQLEYAVDVSINTACSGQIDLPAALNIPDIEFAGSPITNSIYSLQRIRDADTTWFVAPQIPTPRACNSSCVKPPGVNLTIKNSGCGNNNGSIKVDIIDGGTGPYTIEWNTGHTGDSLTNLTPGIYIITVTDRYNCFIVPDTVEILNIPAPVLEIINVIHETCSEKNASAEVVVSDGTSPFIYNWNTNPPQNNAVVSGIGEGVYTVTVTDFNGCTATESVVINNHKEPVIALVDLRNDICGIGSGSARVVVLEGTPPFEYTWSTTPVRHDSVITDLVPGSYTVSVNDGICTVTESFTIIEIPPPDADFIFNPSVVYISDGRCRFADKSTPVIYWRWDFGDGSSSLMQNPVHRYFETGEYTVMLVVKDENDCYDSIQKIIPVREKTTIFVPNAFTPNSNGLNDEFKAVGINVLDFEMYIFTRWGEEVFYSDDIGKGWDGTFKGDPVASDVFTYLILYTADDGMGGFEDKRLVGMVAVLR